MELHLRPLRSVLSVPTRPSCSSFAFLSAGTVFTLSPRAEAVLTATDHLPAWLLRELANQSGI